MPKDSRNKSSFALNYADAILNDDLFYNSEKTFRYRIPMPQKIVGDLTIRLEYDGLTKKELFYSFITLYAEGDKDVKKVVEKIKGIVYDYRDKEVIRDRLQYLRAGKKNRKMVGEMDKKADEAKKMYGLTETETEEIFDILASEEEILQNDDTNIRNFHDEEKKEH